MPYLPIMAVAFFPCHRVIGLLMLVVLTALLNILVSRQSQEGQLAKLLRR